MASDSPFSPGLSRSEARILTRMGSGTGQGAGAGGGGGVGAGVWLQASNAAPANSKNVNFFPSMFKTEDRLPVRLA